jgi:HPt (histidine-containing phosphotransfer) domain-containing protein
MSNLDPDLDLSLLYEIADGSNDFIVESIDMFLDDVPELIGSMEQAIADNNWTDLSSSAHKLKSSLGFFGMATSQSLMQDIEIAAKASAPDTSNLSLKFNEVKDILDANLIALAKIREELLAR